MAAQSEDIIEIYDEDHDYYDEACALIVDNALLCTFQREVISKKTGKAEIYSFTPIQRNYIAKNAKAKQLGTALLYYKQRPKGRELVGFATMRILKHVGVMDIICSNESGSSHLIMHSLERHAAKKGLDGVRLYAIPIRVGLFRRLGYVNTQYSFEEDPEITEAYTKVDTSLRPSCVDDVVKQSCFKSYRTFLELLLRRDLLRMHFVNVPLENLTLDDAFDGFSMNKRV